MKSLIEDTLIQIKIDDCLIINEIFEDLLKREITKNA